MRYVALTDKGEANPRQAAPKEPNKHRDPAEPMGPETPPFAPKRQGAPPRTPNIFARNGCMRWRHPATASLTLLHTADVHLDNPLHGMAEPPAAHRAFEAIIDHALDCRVDVFLIAGDLFDHNRVSDETVAFAQSQLRRLHCPAVILPGNHDCLHPNGIYRRHDFGAVCGNVRVITEPDGQAVTFPELDLVVWGRGMEAHEPGFHPLPTSRHDATDAGT